MGHLVALLRRGQTLSLVTAQNSQSLVIATADRMCRDVDTGRPRALGRVWAVQLNLAGVLADEPVRIADEAYLHVQKLVALHHEFAQRLLEAIDTRDPLIASEPAPSNVIALPARLGM